MLGYINWYLSLEIISQHALSSNSGIFPNFHTYLQNLGWEHPKNITYASTSQGPGVGAYSEYTGRAFTAALKINAGDELFLDYTEEYLDARSPDMDFVPRRADFEMAAKIIENIFLDHTNVAETKRKKTTGSTLEKQDALGKTHISN